PQNTILLFSTPGNTRPHLRWRFPAAAESPGPPNWTSPSGPQRAREGSPTPAPCRPDRIGVFPLEVVIAQQTIDRVREQTNLVELIGESVKLERRGRSYVGLCPFHKEKT